MEPDLIVKPVEITEAQTENARQLTIHSFIIGIVMVVMLNSTSLVDLSRTLPFGPLRETGEALAVTWNARMEAYGLNDFRSDIARRVQEFRERQWPSKGGDAERRDRVPALLSERIEKRDV